MKEDIKILEEILRYKDWYKRHGGEDIGYAEVQAIENLLKAYKEDEAVIEEMANAISFLMTDIEVIKRQFEEKYCEFITSDDDCCWKLDKECTDCIKEYFRNKAKGE